jgi:hypothetical protein
VKNVMLRFRHKLGNIGAFTFLLKDNVSRRRYTEIMVLSANAFH